MAALAREPILWIARTKDTDRPVPQIAQRLRELGHPVQILAWGEPSTDGSPPYLRRVVLDPRPHARRKPRSVHLPSWRLVRDIVRSPARLVIQRDVGPIAAVVGVARLFRRDLRSIALLENHLDAAGPAATTPSKRLPRRLCARTPSVVLANHERAHRQALELGVSESRIVTGWWMAGIDGDAPVVGPSGAGPIRLVFVGKLIPRKGVDLLLDALAGAIADGADLTLTIVGEGERRDELERRCGRLGLRGVVTFAGFVGHDELAGLLDQHDVGVMPSYEDHTGRAGVEAMSRGLPVIASGQSGIAEVLVGHGVNDVVVDPTDRGRFAAELLTLDRARVAHLRQGACETAAMLTTTACTASVLRALAAAAGSDPQL